MRPRILLLFLPALILLAPAAAGAAPGTEIWRIGLRDGSAAEYGGSTADVQYTLPEDWRTRQKWGDFPGTWESADDKGLRLTIIFPLSAVPDAAYLELAVVDADSAAYSCRVGVNGLPLAAQWIGGRDAELSQRSALVTRVYWPVPPAALHPGHNVLTLRSPRENDAGHPSGAGRHDRLNLDYLRLVAGEKNVHKPLLRGAVMYWVTGEAAAYGRSLVPPGGNGIAGKPPYGEDTFDADLEILKLWRINYIRTGVHWAYLERKQDEWHQETLADYEYQFKSLNSHGIKTWVALQSIPHWAAIAKDALQTEPKPGGPPARLEDWIDFCRLLAERLGRYVDNWLIGEGLEGMEPFRLTKEGYLALLKTAHETFGKYDTADADGDGIAAQVAPGGFTGRYGSAAEEYPAYLAWQAAGLFRAVHYADYAWGDYARLREYRRLFPDKELILDKWGAAYWADETKQANEQITGLSRPPAEAFAGGALDEIRYLRFFQEPEVDLDGYAVAVLKGDPNRNCSPDGQGGVYADGNCWVDAEPDARYIVTEGGAYAQHYQWLYSLDAPLYPLAAEYPDEAPVLADAVRNGDRFTVLATSFAETGRPAVMVKLGLPMADGIYRVKLFDPYYPGPERTLEARDGWLRLELELAAGAQTRTVRVEISKK